MEFTIESGPSFSALEVRLEQGESIHAEAGAMAWMDRNISTTTAMRGGLLRGLKRAALAGQSLFQNTYEAGHGGGRLTLCPGQTGDLVHIALEGDEILMEHGAWLAAGGEIEVGTHFQGLKGFFHEGLFAVKASGRGDLFFGGYGDVHPVEVEGTLRVDTGHAVAWEGSLDWRLTRGGQKIRAFLFSDMLMTEFSGKGRIWIQSRNPQSLADWVHPFRRVRSKNDG